MGQREDSQREDASESDGRSQRDQKKQTKRSGRRRRQQRDLESTLFERGKPVEGGQSRSYMVFTREAYQKMVKCLQLAASGPVDVFSSAELRKEWKDVATSSTVRKRWKRLQFNLQVVPGRQEYRQLAWRSSTLIIAPREDWDAILREAHHSDLPPEQHASVRQTIMWIRDKYETRRSRCGITADAIDSFCHRCECYRKLLHNITHGSDPAGHRTARQLQEQGGHSVPQDDGDDDEEEQAAHEED